MLLNIKKLTNILPCRPCETGQNQPLLVWAHLCNVGGFHTLPDPVALLQGVDEHELNTDVVTVRLFKAVQDFPITKITKLQLQYRHLKNVNPAYKVI